MDTTDVVASGAAGLASAAMQANGNKKQMERAYKMNRQLNQQNFDLSNQLAENNYNRNLQQWQMENEYNSPSNQVKRNLEAGINPLWNGVSSVSANSPQIDTIPMSGGSGISYSPQPVDYGQVVQQFMSLQTQALQQDQLRADIEQKKAQTNNFNALALLNGSKNDYMRSGEQFWSLNALYDNLAKSIGNQISQETLNNWIFNNEKFNPLNFDIKSLQKNTQEHMLDFYKKYHPKIIEGVDNLNKLRDNEIEYKHFFRQRLEDLRKLPTDSEDFFNAVWDIIGLSLGASIGLR